MNKIYSLLKYIQRYLPVSNRYKLTVSALKYLKSEKCHFPRSDKSAIIKYISSNLISQINYCFANKYMFRPIDVLFDDGNSLHYVYHNGKKLYFKKGMGKNEIRKMYNTLCVEQDIESPHSYHVFAIHYQPDDIAVDIGAAEGIWALDIMEKVGNLYLFECEESWIEALQATFAPWKEKIHIVNNYVSDFNDSEHTTLDDYFLGKNIFPTIIKADIEGAEAAMVKGAVTLLSKSIHHVILCTYHNFDDYTILSSMMQNQHFEIQTTPGYMSAIYMEPTYTCKDITQLFRKGVIHAHK